MLAYARAHRTPANRKGRLMNIPPRQLCFAWDATEDSRTLKTIEQFLQIIPDAELIQSLERWRGKGRNDCPVRVAVRCLWLTVALRRNPFGVRHPDGVGQHHPSKFIQFRQGLDNAVNSSEAKSRQEHWTFSQGSLT